MTALGVYVGNDPAKLSQFSAWLGAAPDYVHGVVGYADWKDYTSSANWQLNLWKPTGVDIQWSVPLISKEGNLGTAASGAYNVHYKSVAETLLKGTPGDGPIMVRTGWEANGDWFFWNAIGKEEAFKGAFRQMSSTFKEVSDRFQFEWNINHADGGIDPATIYPGDEYVDVIGMDFYYKPEYQGSDPVAAFNQIVNEKYGLQWLEDFAAAHGKPTAYSEWGVKGDDAAPFVRLAKEWFAKHDPVLQSYWDSDAAYPGKLSDNSDPNTGAAFKQEFVGSGSGDLTWADFGGKSTAPAPVPEKAPDIPTQNGGDETTGKPPGADAPVAPAPVPVPVEPPPSPTLPTAPANPVTPTVPEATAAKASGAWTNQSWGGVTWSGSVGNDWHQSTGGGADVMRGGRGDDTYEVKNVGDKVVELAGEGIDTVTTWLSYVLPENVENLTLFGTGWTSGTGNTSNNIIVGNDAPNVLNGKAGHNVLTGGKGADTFVVEKGASSNLITDFKAGEDKLRLDGFADGNSFSALKAAGVQSGADTVFSLSGQTVTLQNFKLDGLVAGDVSFVPGAPTQVAAPTPPAVPTQPVAPVTPTVPEATAAKASGAWTNQSWGGATWSGSVGNDWHQSSGGGADVMRGGRGDDTYEIKNVGDKVVELAGEGVDTVTTWLSYVLPENVENLTLFGTGWTNGTGNASNNIIIGNDAPNVLNGKGGHNILTGGRGADTFVVEKGAAYNLITDFKTGEDKLRLDGFVDGNSFAALKAAGVQSGADTVFSVSGQTVTLRNFKLDGLVAGDVSFVPGAPLPITAPIQPVAPVTSTAADGTVAKASGAWTNQSWGGVTWSGSSGNDWHQSTGGGMDVMRGGKGDDTYEVRNVGDKVVELAGEGVDTVTTWLSYVLPENVENLTLFGTGWTNGTGNASNNIIIGNDAPNVLNGKGGRDILTGGKGDDTFVIEKGLGHDLITDFTGAGVAGGDILKLSGFGSGAKLVNFGNEFHVTASDGSVTQFTLAGVSALGSGDIVWG